MVPHMKILIVEDQRSDALVTEAMLKRSDPHVETLHVSTLEDSIVVASHAKPDAVLLDLQLPDSKDEDTLRVFLDAHPEIPVFVLTGIGDQVTAHRLGQLGAHGFAMKRSSPNELLCQLSFCVGAAEREREHRRDKEALRAECLRKLDSIRG